MSKSSATEIGPWIINANANLTNNIMTKFVCFNINTKQDAVFRIHQLHDLQKVLVRRAISHDFVLVKIVILEFFFIKRQCRLQIMLMFLKYRILGRHLHGAENIFKHKIQIYCFESIMGYWWAKGGWWEWALAAAAAAAAASGQVYLGHPLKGVEEVEGKKI